MLRFILVFTLLTSVSAASHLETVCKSAKQPYPGRSGHWLSNPPTFSKNYISRRYSDENGLRYVVETFDGDLVYESSERLRGVIEAANSLWLLLDYDLLEIDSGGNLLERHPFVFNPTPQTSKALSFTLINDFILIARGIEGVSAFNTQTKKLQWHSNMDGVEGAMAVDVAFDGTNAQVVMATARQDGFTGIVAIELQEGKVLKQAPYNVRRAGVISPDAKARYHNDSLILNNGGWIHIITKKELADAKPFKPRWLAVEVGDDMHLHYMMLEGEFFIENNKLYGCGAYNERRGDDPVRAARLFEVDLN